MKKIKSLLVLILTISIISGYSQDSIFTTVYTNNNFVEAIEGYLVHDNYLYIIGGDLVGDGFITIFNVTDWNNPQQVFNQTYPDYTFRNIIFDDNKLWVMGKDGLTIFNATNPASPAFLVHHETINVDGTDRSLGDYANLIVKSGDLIFVSSFIDRLICANASNPNSLVYQDDVYFNWNTVNEFFIINSTKGVLNDGSGLRYIDFSDPTNLQITLSTDEDYIDLEGGIENLILNMDRTIAYADAYSWGDNYIHVVDLTTNTKVQTVDLSSPEMDPADIGAFALNGNENLLIAGGIESFVALDATDPLNLSFLVKYANGEAPVAMHENYAILTGGIGEPDLVIMEYHGDATNSAPIINDQDFYILESADLGDSVGQIQASDEDGINSYQLISGDPENVFLLDDNTGLLKVMRNTELDAVNTPQYDLEVVVTDNGDPMLSDTATIFVHVVTSFDNDPPVILPQVFNVSESSENGTIIGTVIASDDGAITKFEISAGNSSGTFAINQISGILSVANNSLLNSETLPQFNITVTVTDNGAPPLTSSGNIKINVLAANVPPEINNQTFYLSELAKNGKLIRKVVASDETGIDKFEIVSGNESNIFELDTATGNLYLIDSTQINYIDHPTHSLRVAVTDNGIPPLTDTATVNINIVPAGINNPPEMVNQEFTISENAYINSLVGQVVAYDDNEIVEYIFVSGNDDEYFAIDTLTGEILVVAIGFDATSNPLLNLYVQATDNDGATVIATVRVYISSDDINVPPVLEEQEFSVYENVENGTVIGQVEAIDDTGISIYKILSGNTEDAFSLNTYNGTLTVANNNALDHVNDSIYHINVEIFDIGDPVYSDEGTITIKVLPPYYNDPPVIDDQDFSFKEDVSPGYNVGIVLASDDGEITKYKITAGNSNDVFAMDSLTGLLSINDTTSIEFDIVSQYLLTIQVADNGTPPLNSEAMITIDVIEVIDEDTTSNIASFTIDNSFSAYPNPFNENITIEYNGNSRKELLFINLLGEVIRKEIFYERITIETSDLLSGIYIIKINDFTLKVNKQ